MSGRATLSHQQAIAFYDRFGAKQDLQRFYEDPAVKVLEAHSALDRARTVVELGCGTGRLARRWLAEKLPPEATYLGLDASGTMIQLARERIAGWGGRARVIHTQGSMQLPVADASCDRLVSTYVLDLLSTEDICAFVEEARRVLAPGGLLCLASLTSGQGPLSRAIERLWVAVHSLRPALVGGCRPVRLADHLGASWRLVHREVVCTLGLCTEVVVAAGADEL